MMKIGFVQTSPHFGEKQKNFRAVEELLAGCKADLLVLPELFATGYTFVSAGEVLELSEVQGEETTFFLQHLAGMCNATIVAGFIERENGNCYNSAMMADASGIIMTYRKLHRFNKEKLWFSPGNRAPEVVTLQGVKIGTMICFDWIFPETCRTLALKGAQIVAHPSNLVLPWAQQSMITRCLENHVFAVTANRIGREQRGSDDFIFTGQSQITGCKGEVLASATDDKACVQIIEIDPSLANDKSVNPYNDLFADRLSGFYSI
jgi:predicted amidohydrolase